jgi:hypothetical protein
MALSLQDLNNDNAVFREINGKFGKLPQGRERKWTAGDMKFNKPSHEALSGYDTTKQFTMDLGKSNGTTIPLILVMPVGVAEHGKMERPIPAGTIADK